MELPLHDTALWIFSVAEQAVTLSVTRSVDGCTKDRLYHFVWKLAQNETDTKDIIQTCYARLWQNIATVDDTREVLPLLFTYARNLVIDYLRKKARQRLLMHQRTPSR